jgi:hypothetical protein
MVISLCQIYFTYSLKVIECIFVDTDNPRLPIKGMICNLCGLVQNEKNEICMYCGKRLHTIIQ